MTVLDHLAARLVATAHIVGATLASRRDGDDAERGDVPGWVMITLMTAGLVAALTIIAKPALTDMFNKAMAMVTG